MEQHGSEMVGSSHGLLDAGDYLLGSFTMRGILVSHDEGVSWKSPNTQLRSLHFRLSIPGGGMITSICDVSDEDSIGISVNHNEC